MTKAKTFTALVLILLVGLSVLLHYRNDFARLQRVEIEGTPVEPGTLGKIVLRNTSSSRIEFPLRCYFKQGSDGKPLFSEVVVLRPHDSVEFDLNPEHAGRELPRMVANKACEATWRGPFGMVHSAWWVRWEFRKPPRKSLSS
jgi:hypothetical protein